MKGGWRCCGRVGRDCWWTEAESHQLFRPRAHSGEGRRFSSGYTGTDWGSSLLGAAGRAQLEMRRGKKKKRVQLDCAIEVLI